MTQPGVGMRKARFLAAFNIVFTVNGCVEICKTAGINSCKSGRFDTVFYEKLCRLLSFFMQTALPERRLSLFSFPELTGLKYLSGE